MAAEARQIFKPGATKNAGQKNRYNEGLSNLVPNSIACGENDLSFVRSHVRGDSFSEMLGGFGSRTAPNLVARRLTAFRMANLGPLFHNQLERFWTNFAFLSNRSNHLRFSSGERAAEHAEWPQKRFRFSSAERAAEHAEWPQKRVRFQTRSD